MKVFVYAGWIDNSPKIGTIDYDFINGNEVYSFEYEQSWLEKNNIYFDPNIEDYLGRQYINGDNKFFGFLSDSCPDRWGRMLIERNENLLAKKENRKPRKLYELDYLLNVNDELRNGGFRFKKEDEDEFVSIDRENAIPPYTTLRQLQDASLSLESDSNLLNENWLKEILIPGSSLGGTRPKASVIDEKGNLWIGKFPSKNDEYDVGAFEKTANDLAKMCGILVPESRLEKFNDKGSTFISSRFDRFGSKRIHYSSAMSLLGKKDGDSNNTSYLDIASFIKQYGLHPKDDLIQLFKRMVFNMCISNSDDHLRNHGFLLIKNKWELSPAFDLNPIKFSNRLSLKVDEFDNSISFENAINTYKYYDLTKEEAKQIVNDIIKTVSNKWKKIAKNNGISRSEIEFLSDAFVSEEDVI